MSGVQIPVEAKLDQSDLDGALQKLTQQINRLGQTVAQANKIKFNPIDKATISDLEKVQRQFDSLRKISGDLNKRLGATGQQSSGFFDIDWGKLYSDPAVRARQMRKQFEYVLAGTSAGFASAPSPAPGGSGGRGGGGGGGSNQPPAPPPTPGSSWGSAGRNVVSSGLRAIGPAGGVADNALSAGLSGGAVAGIAGLVGGLLALGVGKAIGAVMQKVGAAQQENIGYDTLKRQLGDVNVNFGVLKDSLRTASSGLDMTFEEGHKLATEFVKLSGMTEKQYKTLASEINIAGGFGRSYGVDPSQSTAFFAQMRQFQVTSNESDSRRLALLVGEAVAKSGSSAKMDEVLQAIASYTAQQTRLGLTTANVGGYAGMLSGLVGSRTPGLDPMGASNILSRVNAAFATGGSAGEAGQNFMYASIGRTLGLDPIQATMLREQGAFGTGAQTFGKGSLWSNFAAKYGLSTPGTAASSNATNLQLVMDHMSRVYAGKPELMLSAMSNLFGIGTMQAAALASIPPDHLGDLQKRLAENDIDIKDVNSTGISRISQISSDSTLSDDEKNHRIREVASQDQEKTEGSETRRTIVGVSNEIQKMSDRLIGPLNVMRDGILFLAGGGKKGPMEIQRSIREAESRERAGMINTDYDARLAAARKAATDSKSAYDNAWEDARKKMGSMTPEQRAETQKKLADMRAQADAARENILKLEQERTDALKTEEKKLQTELDDLKRGPSAKDSSPSTASSSPWSGVADKWDRAVGLGGPAGTPGTNLRGDAWLMRELAETDRQLGLPAGTSAAQIARESDFNPTARSKKGAMGLAQVMPDTLASLEKRLGRKLNPDDPRDAVIIQRKLMGENLHHFGNVPDALSAYNGGWDRGNWNNAETRAYAPSIMGSRGMYATPLPANAPSPTAQKQNITVEGNFTLNNPNGSPAAPPVTIKKDVGAPTPFGSIS